MFSNFEKKHVQKHEECIGLIGDSVIRFFINVGNVSNEYRRNCNHHPKLICDKIYLLIFHFGLHSFGFYTPRNSLFIKITLIIVKLMFTFLKFYFLSSYVPIFNISISLLVLNFLHKVRYVSRCFIIRLNIFKCV